MNNYVSYKHEYPLPTLHGFYRGTVLQQLEHGLCKIYVYGVYSKNFINDPNRLPIAEPATPLFGGGDNGNGIFSYPNIGSTVWVFFANGDQNYPVYFAQTLGGMRAKYQYDIVTDNAEHDDSVYYENPQMYEVEPVSGYTSFGQHRFSVGKTNTTMFENGMLCSRVSDPIETEISSDTTGDDIRTAIDFLMDVNTISSKLSTHISKTRITDSSFHITTDGETVLSTENFTTGNTSNISVNTTDGVTQVSHVGSNGSSLITIKSGGEISISSTTSVNISSPSISLNAPQISLNGTSISLAGSAITINGSAVEIGGLTKIDQKMFLQHTHTTTAPGAPTSPPN